MKYRFYFLCLVLIAGIISTFLHEFGHCIFYWIQGIPASMSLVMEFPLIDITHKQYGIGSAGGPLVNILLIAGAYGLIRNQKKKSIKWSIYSAIIVSNSFYLIFRSLLGIAKNDGGEIESSMNLFGLNFYFAAGFFLILSFVMLVLWVRKFKIKTSIGNFGYYILLFILYLSLILVMEAIDTKYFWKNYPTITIGDDKIHNPH